MTINRELHLILFVVEHEKHNVMISELTQLVSEYFGEEGHLEVVDVLSMPEKALENDIYATPMLLRNLPEPIVKLLVNISSIKDGFLAVVDPKEKQSVLL